ncbi:Uncharacterised protein [Mycobacterium tuberculosis]|nr:Uncharacterised protein [Mycobacterium tuberculosis]
MHGKEQRDKNVQPQSDEWHGAFPLVLLWIRAFL